MVQQDLFDVSCSVDENPGNVTSIRIVLLKAWR